MDCRDGADCVNLDVFADNTGIINITRIGSSNRYGCSRNNNIYAANADQLYIYADYNGIGGAIGTTIFGQNIVTTLEITAIGRNSSFVGITGATQIYIPSDLSKLSLNCYGFGCYIMTFVQEDGFDNAASANFNVNGCSICQDDGMF